MTRVIESRFKLSGNLLAESPLHVGGIGNNSLVDLSLAINGKGQYYIPGTSLAGALRSWMRDYNYKLTEQLWGFQEENKGHASFVLVEDCLIDENALSEIRDGVGIDRILGAAADKIKYDRAILPKGTLLPLDLTVEVQKDFSELALNAFYTLIAALCSGEIRLGAAKTRGLGKIKLCLDYEFKQQNLLERQGILDALRGIGKDLKKQQSHSNNKQYHTPKINFKIKWKPIEPLMVKTERDGITVDILPLVSAVNTKVALVIPGSSIKGALRFQAERIIRTLGVKSANQHSHLDNIKQKFFSNLELPLITTLFGKSAEDNHPNQPQQVLPGLSALSVEDCYSEKMMDASDWQKVEDARDKDELRQALDGVNLNQTQQAYHVAIDRWTGDAADGFLYSNLEPFGVEWEEINLSLNLNRIPENEHLPALALLLLVLRDLADGRIPLGYGVNRGMGAIAVNYDDINLQAQGIQGKLNLQLLILEKLEQGVKVLEPQLLEALNPYWQAWISSNQIGEAT